MDKKTIFFIGTPIVLITTLWIVFYPPIYAIRDEAGYLAQAYVMRKGTVFGDVAGIQVISSIENFESHSITKYSPGMPALLVPFTFFGWKTVFLLPLILHIAGFLVFSRILTKLHISPYFALLYLLYPTSILYSRTIMADIPSAVFTLLAIFFFIKGRLFYLISGIVLGLLLLLRYSNVIIALPFFIFAFIDIFREKGEIRQSIFHFLLLLFGFIPALLMLLLYNKIAFGGFISTGYGIKEMFGFSYIPKNLPFYIFSLITIYPMMFPSIFLLRKKRALFVLISLIVLLFYSAFYYITIAPGKNLIKTAVVGMRFILPVAPLLMVAYADLLERLKKKFKKPVLSYYGVLMSLFLMINIIIIKNHQDFLKRQEILRNAIYENTENESLILINYDAMEFFQPIWGGQKFAMFVYWQDRISVDFNQYEFDKLYLLTVIRSDKEGNEYVKRYAEEIVEEYDSEIVKEIKGDPELKLWRLKYESDNESEPEHRGNGETEREDG